MERIERSFLEALAEVDIAEGERVVIGFSGGPDSMALALLCVRFRLPCMLAHLDHAVRAGSDAEEAALAAFASKLGCGYASRRTDVPAMARREGIGIEEAGRNARTDFLETVRRESGCRWILTGHQADDLVEDVLLRLVRGTSWPALGGMAACDARRHLLRPLLGVTRREIEAYVAERGETPLLDPTNCEDDYRRNRLRHHAVPLLKAENPALEAGILRLWSQARDDKAFWEEYLTPILARTVRSGNRIGLPEAAVKDLPRAARLRALAAFLRDGGVSVRSDTLSNLDTALLRPQRPKRLQFHGGECELRGGMLTIRRG